MWNAGFELVSSCPHPATITITPRAPPTVNRTLNNETNRNQTLINIRLAGSDKRSILSGVQRVWIKRFTNLWLFVQEDINAIKKMIERKRRRKIKCYCFVVICLLLLFFVFVFFVNYLFTSWYHSVIILQLFCEPFHSSMKKHVLFKCNWKKFKIFFWFLKSIFFLYVSPYLARRLFEYITSA